MLNYGLRQHNFQPLPWVAHTGAECTWHSWGRALHEHLGSDAALAGMGAGGLAWGHREAGEDGRGQRGKFGEQWK